MSFDRRASRARGIGTLFVVLSAALLSAGLVQLWRGGGGNFEIVLGVVCYAEANRRLNRAEELESIRGKR